MDSVGKVNINVKNNFLNLWYKKKKITFPGIYLTIQEGPKKVHEEEIVRKQIVENNDT
jgi:hypothetical protein